MNPSAPHSPSVPPHIAVIGAGVTGVTTCHALLERGYRVTLIDRRRYAAMETSFANGGQLSASNAEVWNRISTIVKGLKWMARRDAPLLVNPRPSWHKASWMLSFMAAVRRYEANTVATVRLAIAAREHLHRLAEAENIDFNLEQRGILHIYESEREYRHGEKVNDLLAQGGLERRAVSPAEIREIEPAIARDLYGGFFTPSDATGDIHKFTRGLAEACLRRGAEFLTNTEVRSLHVENGGVRLSLRNAGSEGEKGGEGEQRFDAVVISAGVGSRELARQAGDRVNVYPVKGYSITVPLEDEASQRAAPWVSLLDDETKIVASRLGPKRYRVAGTAEFNGFNRDIRDDRVQPLVRWVERYFPGVDTSACIPWAGLRPMMPDMMPHVGPGRSGHVFYNTGHGHLGWTLSPATAQIVGDAVASRLPVPRTVPASGERVAAAAG